MSATSEYLNQKPRTLAQATGDRMTATAERNLARETAAANALRQALMALTDDPEAVRDTIEGETTLREDIVSVMASIREDEVFELGLDAMIDKLAERQQRIQERIERKRTAILQAMVIGEIPSLELADATLFVRKVPRKVEISDEALIPSEYWKQPDPTLDKSALASALKEGKDVPGATLDNGGIGLTIRRA